MKKISRRDFLKVTGLVGAAAALTACGGAANPPPWALTLRPSWTAVS